MDEERLAMLSIRWWAPAYLRGRDRTLQGGGPDGESGELILLSFGRHDLVAGVPLLALALGDSSVDPVRQRLGVPLPCRGELGVASDLVLHVVHALAVPRLLPVSGTCELLPTSDMKRRSSNTRKMGRGMMCRFIRKNTTRPGRYDAGRL